MRTVVLAFFTLSASAQSLDYQFFKERVQPVFLKKRPGHARCVTCHDHGSPPLEPLAPGAETWTEEQSRKNYAVWKQFVRPGEPMKSKLLLHPLAVSAGGDVFHAGGKHWQSQGDPEWQALAEWVGRPKSANVVLQSNSAGDNIHVIDAGTNVVIGTIEGIDVPHGVAIAPGGARIYVSNESLHTLDVVEAKGFRVTTRVPLSGRPNNVAVGRDGKWVYVAIREGSGAVDVIDTVALTKEKTIPVKGAVHNVYVTPDGKWAVAGSIEGAAINVIDTAKNELAWTLPMSAGVRPMAFTANEVIVQLSDFHGFVVVDFASRKELRRVTLPDPPGKEKETQGIQGSPSHGLAITPDSKLLWVASKWYGYVAAYSLPGFRLLRVVEVGSHPEWLTIPSDGKNVYVALAGNDAVAVVDNQTFRLVKTIPVGAVPKRNTSGVLSASFDVASVKPSPPPAGDLININLGAIRNGGVTLGNATLADCIKFAYGLVSDDQLAGPDWIKSKSVRFDIVAKAPPKTPREELLSMLKTLLNERFHLNFHVESRTFPHLVLSVANGGSKMTEVDPDRNAPRGPALLGHIVHPQISTHTLALLLSRQMKTLVLDRTGLQGAYDIDLRWTPEGSEVDNGPSIYTAVREQLGLRLESRKEPVAVMVVESADRVPVEN